jgi:hypothetical protein
MASQAVDLPPSQQSQPLYATPRRRARLPSSVNVDGRNFIVTRTAQSSPARRKKTAELNTAASPVPDDARGSPDDAEAEVRYAWCLKYSFEFKIRLARVDTVE